jgi:ethanolamine permease
MIALVIFYGANSVATSITHSTIIHSNLTRNWPAAIPYAIWLYLAIEGVAMTAEEVIHPEKDIARGFILAITTMAVCSALTLIFTAIHSHDPRAAIDYPLSHTLAELYGAHSWIARSVDILGLFGLLASLNGIIMGYTRQVYALSIAKQLPQFLSKQTKNGTPIWALLIPGLFGLICAGSANISNSLIIVAAFGAILMYCITLISLFKLRFIEPQTIRPYKVFYPWLPGLGLILGLMCLVCVINYALMPGQLVFLSWHLHLDMLVIAILAACYLAHFNAKRV